MQLIWDHPMRQFSTVSTPSRIENGLNLPTKSALVGTPASQYFSDGKRLIDYVLVYGESNTDDDDEDIEFDNEPKNKSGSVTLLRFGIKKASRREIFESNLQKLGLELEYASAKYSNTKFVLIHAPFKVLKRQAERLRIRMPICQNDLKKNTELSRGGYGWGNQLITSCTCLEFNEKVKKRTEMQGYFTQPFMQEHLECFVNHEDEENFFPRTERSRMVYDLLIRTRYEPRQSTQVHFGIHRLLYNRVYLAVYPIHEELSLNKGKITKEPVDLETCSDRQFLYETWAKVKNWYKYQPLHLIQKYFGTQLGFYFAWLGYYTRFSYTITLIGILCTLYGLFTMANEVTSNEICHNNTMIMCPICDHYCDFTFLNGSCLYSKISYVFDNNATVFYTVIMCIWATLFLEGWKRYQAEIAYKWNVFDLEPEDIMRPEFQFYAKRARTNPVTDQQELYMPVRDKFLRLMVSTATVLFVVSLIMALTIGMVVYRVIVMTVFREYDDDKKTYQSNAILFSSITAAIINLIFILIMNYLCYLLALKLTEWECPKTQYDFDNSYTVKIFLFQFVNYYSSLFYIAFFKGRASIYIRGKRLDQCDPAGCTVELVIQLFVIMAGQQFINAFVEIGYNIVYWFVRRWQLKLPNPHQKGLKRVRREVICSNQQLAQYEKDYALNPAYDQFLCDEYLEMAMQFGFITLFAAVFPLAPLFALINNIFEMRLDAYKLLVTVQRPMPAQVKDIGIWMTILEIMSFLAVLCNKPHGVPKCRKGASKDQNFV
uniref:Anoctamin n=1 Tax=Acrobeloides nanus TaxID=290746 RepID=A0A914DX58_9BILA